MVAGAKLMALGTWSGSSPEKNGVGTEDSNNLTTRGCSNWILSEEKLGLEVMVTERLKGGVR